LSQEYSICINTLHKGDSDDDDDDDDNNNNNNLIPKELKGCHSGTKGCKDQLLISKQYCRNVNAGRKI
jgi:hypothetical protein